MSKQIIHIGLAVATDTWLPGEGNILSIAAHHNGDQFKVNILPQIVGVEMGKFWKKNKDAYQAIQTEQVGLKKALRDLNTWLERYHGTLIAITTPADYFNLTSVMLDEFKKCPIGHMLDARTLRAVRAKDFGMAVGQKESVLPWEAAAERWKVSMYFPNASPITAGNEGVRAKVNMKPLVRGNAAHLFNPNAEQIAFDMADVGIGNVVLQNDQWINLPDEHEIEEQDEPDF